MILLAIYSVNIMLIYYDVLPTIYRFVGVP